MKNRVKFIFLMLLTGFWCPISVVNADTQYPENSWQKKYLWQLGDFPTLPAQFTNSIKEDLKEKDIPSNPDKRYLWQTNQYQELNKEFADTITQKKEAVPSTPQERYLWQINQHHDLNKEFSRAIAQDIQPNPVPATKDEQYQWQLRPYGELKKEFQDIQINTPLYKDRPLNP